MDPGAALQLLRRRWLPIVACLLAGIIGAVVVTNATPRTYKASARLFINIPAARGVQEALQGFQLSSQLLQSYAKIATSRAAATRVSDELDGRFGAGEIRSKLSADPQPQTLLIDISAVDTDPESARDIANAAASAFTDILDDLETADAGAVEARLIDPAVTPTTPVAPRPKVDLAIGIMLGLLAGISLALVLESLDQSITTSEQATAAFGAPVLAVLPRQRRLESQPLIALEGSTSPAGEAYRSLRTSLRFLNASSPLSTILVTSASAGEGKTATAANLAIAVAEAGERVILIDADLRKPRLAELFGIEDGIGLSNVLSGTANLEAALQDWRATLRLIPHGPLPPNPSELLGSEAMVNLLEEAKLLADVVIIDAPPILPVTDATVLSALVDGVVLVARWAVTDRSDAEEARFTLDGVGARVVGVALNAVRGSRRGVYYRDYERPAVSAQR